MEAGLDWMDITMKMGQTSNPMISGVTKSSWSTIAFLPNCVFRILGI